MTYDEYKLATPPESGIFIEQKKQTKLQKYFAESYTNYLKTLLLWNKMKCQSLSSELKTEGHN